MNNSNETHIDIGVLPCPEWCTKHQGDHATTSSPIPDDATLDDMEWRGAHVNVTYWYKRFPNWPHPTAVQVRQVIETIGIETPQILFWHGHSRVDDIEGAVPTTYRPLRSKEARELGEALIRAADIVGEILSSRCVDCGEPVEESRTQCLVCEVDARSKARRSRRERFSVIAGGAGDE